ncbi:MAG: methyltransferase domain-containing protein [Chitinispirillaceae bacterium]|nr:methyltransferase domain-containing protein [Chitinispirillaceae bacterium]
MQQDDRRFSRAQYLSGRWHTTVLRRSHPLLTRLLKSISFKYEEMDRFTSRCFPGALVVDLGAGIGSYAGFFLRHTAATLIAVDWSPEALGRISVSTEEPLWKICADAHFLPFKPATIDALYSIDTLGHLRRQEQALDEIHRVCRSGAPLFLHSECADYRSRWPDRMLIRKLGSDRIAELDGHVGIRPAADMRILYERRFSIDRFFSPAGMSGWLTGYPEKYLPLFLKSRTLLPVLPTLICAVFRKLPFCKPIMRLLNTFTNRVELFLGLQGGGSCFAQGRTLIADPSTDDFVPPSIDVIIPTYNRPDLPGRLILSLLYQLRKNDRIFVIWQGNQRPSVTTDDRRIVLLHQPKPNLPAARNTGLHAGGNPIILYSDDDCIADEHLLDEHRTIYKEPGIGATAGYTDDPLFPSDAKVPSRFDPATGELVQHFALPQSGPSLSVMGANMSFRRTALEQVGGFDTNFHRNALWEEIDVSFRLQNAGFLIRYSCDAKVKHLRECSGGCRQDRSARYLFHQFANTAYFACTYMPRQYLRSWITYWKYRLEFSARRDEAPKTAGKILRYRPFLIVAGIAGTLSGCIRFLVYGKRVGLPPITSVAQPENGEQR